MTQQQSIAATPYPFAKVGLPAPDFKLLSTKNMESLEEYVSLEDYKGKWLVLFFCLSTSPSYVRLKLLPLATAMSNSKIWTVKL